MPLSGAWKNPKHTGGERFALLVITLYAKEGEPCRIKDLMEETGMSKRQIVRIVDDLKAAGTVITEEGKGRAPLIIKPASYNDAKMSSQEGASDDITSHDKVTSQEESTERSDAKMSSLYDATPLCHDNASRSDDIMPGTEVALSKDLRTSTDNKKTLSPRARAQAEPKRERETRFPLEVRKAYATVRGCGDGWLHTSRDGRYDDLIEGWQQEGAEQAAPKSPTTAPELTPEELQEQVNVVAEMLKSGRTLSDIRSRLGSAIRPAQWQQIASTAQAQARVKPKASESPPPKVDNVVPMARAHR